MRDLLMLSNGHLSKHVIPNEMKVNEVGSQQGQLRVRKPVHVLTCSHGNLGAWSCGVNVFHSCSSVLKVYHLMYVYYMVANLHTNTVYW